MWKKILVFSFYSELSHNPRTTKVTHGKSRQVWAWLGMSEHTQLKIVIADASFPW